MTVDYTKHDARLQFRLGRSANTGRNVSWRCIRCGATSRLTTMTTAQAVRSAERHNGGPYNSPVDRP